jgi:hypothetical protein
MNFPLRRSLRSGGPWNQWLDHRGALAMRRAAWNLPPPEFGSEPPLELHLLTGRAFAAQSLFCLWSFARAAWRDLAPVFHDDGSLQPSLVWKLRAIFPRARVVTHERFRFYPHLRKLISPHLGSTGWKLVLDSDLLFFRRPGFILNWLAHPAQPLHMTDVADAYGYSRPLLEHLAGAPVAARLNGGLCGLLSEELEWEKLEWWCARLIRAEGTSYFLEQALLALLTAGRPCAIAPSTDYITQPARDEALAPRAVMHHYVDQSKRWYLRAAWRLAAAA